MKNKKKLSVILAAAMVVGTVTGSTLVHAGEEKE